MKKIILILMMLAFVTIACKKEVCKECFVEETNSTTGIITTNSLGMKCGSELDNTDGKTYQAFEGPVRTYCQ